MSSYLICPERGFFIGKMDIRQTALPIATSRTNIFYGLNLFKKDLSIFFRYAILPFVKKTLKKIYHHFSLVKSVFTKKDNLTRSQQNTYNPNMNKENNKEKLIKFGVFIVVLIGLVFVVSRIFRQGEKTSSAINNPQVKGAVATADINKEFTFPIKDAKGQEISNLKYKIEKAELRDQIVVKGQKADAVSGKYFLVVNLKIGNDYNQTININTRNYIRLSLNGNKSELLAPDIHNDPVEIQAISTKNTRVGFPVNVTDKDFVLLVGEIEGNKEEIPLNF